jgi:hypothetical protein
MWTDSTHVSTFVVVHNEKTPLLFIIFQHIPSKSDKDKVPLRAFVKTVPKC